MKLKGINPAEQHVEKIVLGVVAAVLLLVLTMQFAFAPPGVTVGNQQVPPDRALEPVLDEARRNLAAMNNPEPSLPDVSAQALAPAFQSAISAPTVPEQRIAALGPSQSLGAIDLDVSGIGGMYAMPSLPQPTAPMASAFRGTVHPSEWAASEALRELLGDEQPFDLGVVSVQAFLNGQDVRRALLSDPDGDAGPLRAIPPSWWRPGFEILGVQLERERRLSDGSWGETTLVSGMPGRPDLVAESAQTAGLDAVALLELARFASSEAEQITKPDFYRTIAGERWQPPASNLQSTDPNRDQVQRLVRQARGYERDIQVLRDAMEGESTETRTPPAGGGGPAGRGAPGAGGRAEPRQPAERGDARAQRLERLNEQLAQVENDLYTLGYAIDGTRFETDQLPVEVFGKFERLFDNDRLAMWSHDVTAQGGEVYRYRLRPVFNNPVFGRGQALSEEQQNLAQSMHFPGPWSQWSEPVEALASEYFFVVNAREADRLGGGPQASVELYRFFYGHYRRASMAAAPGDMLVAEARVPSGLMLFDLSQIEQLDDITQPLAQPGRPAGREEFPGRGMPDPRDQDPRGRGIAEPARGTPGQTPGTPASDLPGTPAPERLRVAVDVLLLDVARLPGSGGQQTEGAIVETRDEFRAFLTPVSGGQILVRVPSIEQQSAVYQAVEASWRAGQRASQPAEVPEEPTRPRREERAPTPTRQPGGGGGGSGGAG